MTQVEQPTHRLTKHGLVVHRRTIDHLRDDTPYQRFNKAAAVWITKNVGTMTAFWVFTVLSMFILPSCLYIAGWIHLKMFLTTFGFNLFGTWVLSTVLELILMPAIMVGQNIQSAASDVRAEKQFEDTEEIRNDMTTALDRLNVETAGGIRVVLDRFDALEALVNSALKGAGAGSNASDS